ncbi:MAG: hypothetical protein ACJA01_001090 [Saprospiraceae bacterium]|jgi:hypothetical protein
MWKKVQAHFGKFQLVIAATRFFLEKGQFFGAEPVDLQKDSVYHFSVFSFAPTDFDICLYKLPPPPPNDSCINATALMRSPIDNCAYISGTTIGATNTSEVYISESDTSSAYQKFVWYSFIPDSSGLYNLEIDEKESTSAYWQATTGDCSDTLMVIKSLFNTSGPALLQKDSVYHFWVYSIAPTDFDICLYKLPPPSPNDSCINAIVLTESAKDNCSYISGTTVDASRTSEIYISESDTSSAYQKFVWYSFIPDSSGNYSLDVNTDSEFFNNSRWQVTTGDCSDTLVIIKELFSNNNFATLQKDSSYLFSILTSSETTFDLCLYKNPPPPNDSCTTAIELMAGDIGQCNAISGNTRGATSGMEYVR